MTLGMLRRRQEKDRMWFMAHIPHNGISGSPEKFLMRFAASKDLAILFITMIIYHFRLCSGVFFEQYRILQYTIRQDTGEAFWS